MKLNVSVALGLVGCKKKAVLDIPDEEFEGLDEDAREKVFESYAKEWLWDTIDFGWSAVE